MGCCLNCLKTKDQTAKVHSESAKPGILPMISSKEEKSTPRTHNPHTVIRLDKRPVMKEHPAMKVIYSKKIINRDDPDFSPIQNHLTPLARGESAELEKSFNSKAGGLMKATISQLAEQENIKTNSIKENSVEGNNSKLEESTSENFIEVNELNFLSKLKNKTKPKIDTPRERNTTSPKGERSKKIIQDDAKSTWAKQYSYYLSKQLADWQAQLSLQGNKEFGESVRPAFLIIAPDESVTASHPKESDRSPVNYLNSINRPGMVQPDNNLSKYSMNNIRKRNQTAPHLNLISEIGKISKFPPKLQSSKFQKSGPYRHIDHPTPSIPEEEDSPKLHGKSVQETNPSRGLGSSDSLSLPQFTLRKKLTPSVKSFHHSMKAKINELQHASNSIIVEQDSEDNDESIDQPATFGADHDNSLAKRFVDFKIRNKTTVPPLHKGDQSSIFDTIKEINCEPAIKETSKIKETEDESYNSELLGDRLFKDLGISENSQD